MRVHSSCPCAAIKQLVNFSALGTRTRCQLPVGGCLRLLPPKIARVATQAAQAVCLLHGNSWELSTRLFFCTPFVCSLYNCNVLFSPSLFSLSSSLSFFLPLLNNENSRCTISRGGHRRCCAFFQSPNSMGYLSYVVQFATVSSAYLSKRISSLVRILLH